MLARAQAVVERMGWTLVPFEGDAPPGDYYDHAAKAFKYYSNAPIVTELSGSDDTKALMDEVMALKKQLSSQTLLLSQVAMTTVVALKELPDTPPDLPPVPEGGSDLPPIGDVTSLDAETLKALMGGGAGAVPDMPMPPNPPLVDEPGFLLCRCHHAGVFDLGGHH